MRRYGVWSLLGIAWIHAPHSVARAGGNTCFREGQKIDDRTTPKPFTGVYTCKDMDSGKLTLREHLVADVREGAYEKYDARDGSLDESGSYRHGKLHGSMKRYHAGVPYLEFHYVDGQQEGVQRDFRDGHLSRLYLVYDQGKVGNELTFNRAGQLMSLSCRGHAIDDKDLALCGMNGKQSNLTFYDEEGRKRETLSYLAGVQQGVEQRFNLKTGKLHHEAHYEHGKQVDDGERAFDEAGRLRFKTDCAAPGKTVCTETRMFEGTELVERVTVRDKARLTKQTDYYQNGQANREQTAEGDHYRIVSYSDRGAIVTRGRYLPSGSQYRDYIPDGLVEQLSAEGQVVSKQTFLRGELDGPSVTSSSVEGHAVRRESDYTKGTLVREKLFVDDKPISEWTYFPDGSVKTTQHYGASPIQI